MTRGDQLHAEQHARVLIDEQLRASGRCVGDAAERDLIHHPAGAVREVRIKRSSAMSTTCCTSLPQNPRAAVSGSGGLPGRTTPRCAVGRVHSQIRDLLYTQHAVDRLQLSVLGPFGGSHRSGRSISSNFYQGRPRGSRSPPLSTCSLPGNTVGDAVHGRANGSPHASRGSTRRPDSAATPPDAVGH